MPLLPPQPAKEARREPDNVFFSPFLFVVALARERRGYEIWNGSRGVDTLPPRWTRHEGRGRGVRMGGGKKTQ